MRAHLEAYIDSQPQDLRADLRAMAASPDPAERESFRALAREAGFKPVYERKPGDWKPATPAKSKPKPRAKSSRKRPQARAWTPSTIEAGGHLFIEVAPREWALVK